MRDRDAWAEGAAADLPVLFVVDADEGARAAAEAALHRRFAPDYRVLSSESHEAGLAALEGLAHRREPVALVASALGLGVGTVEFLGRARAS